MNRAEFETMYKAKYLNLLPEDDANKFIEDAIIWRLKTDGTQHQEEIYDDDHLQLCWRNYVMQCAIDDICEHYQIEFSWSTTTAFEKWISDNPQVKALFDLRSKGD